MNLLLHLHYVQGDQMELIKNDQKVCKNANLLYKMANSRYHDYVAASPFLYNVYAIPTVMLNK